MVPGTGMTYLQFIVVALWLASLGFIGRLAVGMLYGSAPNSKFIQALAYVVNAKQAA